MKNRVLLVNPYYLPGYKSGGPQRTLQNVCDFFSKYNDIYIVTKNVDFGETDPYNVETNVWLKKYGVSIMYIEPENYNVKIFRDLYKQFDVIYACGLFCRSTIDFMLINKQNDAKILYVAPMGVFSKNALTIRGIKKKLFLKTFSALGAFKKIVWSFTSDEEKNEALDAIGNRNIKDYIIAEDLPRKVDFELMKKKACLYDGPLKVVFLSRIVPKKNLLYAIEILKNIGQGDLFFDIYGFKEDKTYWAECVKAIRQLPNNIVCNYCGGVNAEDSVHTFAKYDIFLFPTQGENLGHVIYESLAAGCIPVISDTTPWKDFDDKNCRKVISLQNLEGFRGAIKEYLNYDHEKLKYQKLNAIEYAERKYHESVSNSGYKQIFEGPKSHVKGNSEYYRI